MLNKSNHQRKKIKYFIFSLFYLFSISLFIIHSHNRYNNWVNENEVWRELNIKYSPRVCITATGIKYHRCYHYAGRNKSISLFEAVEKGYEPCLTCSPPIIKTLNAKPLKPNFFIINWKIITLFCSILYIIIFLKIIL